MSLEKIQQALINQLLTGGFQEWETQKRIAWENTSYTPAAGKQYLQVFFMPAASRVASLGTAGRDEESGLFQVTLCIPADSGELDSRKTIDLLRSCFRPGVVSYSGQSVTILNRSRAGGFKSDTVFKIPFTVSWRTQLTR